MSDSELTEGLKKKEALLDYRQPLSQYALRRIASSPAGEPFGYIQNSRFTFPHRFDIIPCYGIYPA